MIVKTLMEFLSTCPPNATVLKVDKSGWGLTDVETAKSQPILSNWRNADYRGAHQAFAGALERDEMCYATDGVILLSEGETISGGERMEPVAQKRARWTDGLGLDDGSKSRIDKAIIFATKAHAGQKRKGTDIDYIVHPLTVGKLLADAGCEEDAIIAGYLHDAVEDCDKVTLADVAHIFGYRVAGIVEGCSESDKTLPWKERKEHSISYLATAPTEVRLVVTCDKLHNATSMLADYASCGEKLWSRFNQGRSEQQWYYSSTVEALGRTGFKTHPLHIALAAAVAKLFPPPQVVRDEVCEADYELEEQGMFAKFEYDKNHKD